MPEVDIEAREKSRKRRQTEFEKKIEERFYDAIGSALLRQKKFYVKVSIFFGIFGIIIGVILKSIF